MKLFSWAFLLLICCGARLIATIVQIDDLKLFEEQVYLLDENALILLDVDETLIVPQNVIERSCGYDLYDKLYREVLTNAAKKYPADYFSSKMLASSKSLLIDPHSVTIVRNLQGKGIPTIALTAMATGSYGIIESLADLRVKNLKELGFDFSQIFKKTPFLEFPKSSYQIYPPVFKEGVLFSSHHPKGIVLGQFLNAIGWYPAKVIFIDDRLDFLQSVQREMTRMGISFVGYLYTAAEQVPCELDEELAEFQFKHLAEHGEWLCDEDAKQMMLTNSLSEI